QLLEHVGQEAAFLGGRDQADIGPRKHVRMARERNRERIAFADAAGDRLEYVGQSGVFGLALQYFYRFRKADAGLEQQRKALGEYHALGHTDRPRSERDPAVQAEPARWRWWRHRRTVLGGSEFDCHTAP